MLHALAKPFLACLATVAGLLVAGDAAAQTGYGGTLGTTTAPALVASDFTFYLQYYDDGDWIQMNATEQAYFFNRARCECNADQADYSGHFRIAIQLATTTADKIKLRLNENLVGSGNARLYAGGNVVNCLNPSSATAGTYSSYCLNLINPANANESIEGGMAAIGATRVWYSNPIPVAWLFNAASYPVCSGSACDSTANCDTASATVTIYFWAQTSSQQTPDMQDSSFNVNLVGKSAFVPEEVTAEGGNEALTVHWSWPNNLSPSGNAAFMGLQIFCVRGADAQVFESGSFDAAFMTAGTTCQDSVPPSTGIAVLDPDYLCSGLLPSTSTSHRITGLQNGISYGVAVAAIDKYKNASAVSTLAYGAPIPTVDFYTQYKNAGGAAQGGFCSLAGRARPPGLLALAGLAGLGLLGRRRRPRRRSGAGPLAVLLAASTLAASPAKAQAVYHDDDLIHEEMREPWSGTPRSFAVEARFGLYTPAVDSEFSGDTAGPQAFIFGTKPRPMWQLEFDWQVFQAFGSLAIGGAIGYYKENAKACLQATLTPENCDRTGDNTSLRLIPLAGLLVYRFDVLAERWRIPLVPYGKVGLNYTIWTVTDGNGNIPSAGGGRGQGGTWGWQGAVGLALRLDFLDPGAARGFDADAGVNHTYAFFELATVHSSGLGQSKALHVGDDTWFAGLTFEF